VHLPTTWPNCEAVRAASLPDRCPATPAQLHASLAFVHTSLALVHTIKAARIHHV
jgi:hypothetical protein